MLLQLVISIRGFAYTNECPQIYDGHFKSMIIDRNLHVCYHQYDIFLQTNWQLLPVHFEHAIGHCTETIDSQFSKVAVSKQDQQTVHR